jgi:hypothetical protein
MSHSPDSFSFKLMQSEMLSRWPTPYPTPYPTTGIPQDQAYIVTGTATPLTAEFMREWFVQSIIPLVGKEAADALDALIMHKKGASGDEFLKQAIESRQKHCK